MKRIRQNAVQKVLPMLAVLGPVFTALGLVITTLGLVFSLCGCETGGGIPDAVESSWVDAFTEPVELQYAEQFTVNRDRAGRILVTIAGTDRFLLLPEGVEPPKPTKGAALEYMADGTTVLRLPLESIYVAASSAMDFFVRLDALDAVEFTGTSLSNWGLEPVRDAMKAGRLQYAGKYSAPDFELLLSEGCPLAVESTMIYHSPDIREQLETLGIPVLVERSSYEPHPLGRMEWIKLYGFLTGHEAEAAAFFTEQAERVERIQAETVEPEKDETADRIQTETREPKQNETGEPERNETAESVRAEAGGRKTAAFFSVSPNGYINIRRPGDYVAKMIEMAGGYYVFSDLLPGENSTALSTMNLQMEAFYAGARDADILIYNGTIDGGIETLEQLFGRSELFAEFKAVRTGDVWCTERNFFQEPTAAGQIIADFHAVFSGTAGDSLPTLHRLT